MIDGIAQLIGVKRPSPVACVPLSKPTAVHTITNIKGCTFNPSFDVQPHRLYLIVVTRDADFSVAPGFYEIPERGELIWIRDFKLLAVSGPNEWGARCWVVESFEGDPPANVEPIIKKPALGLVY